MASAFGGPTAEYVLGKDGNLWLEQMPLAPIVFSTSTSGATSSMGLWPSGNTYMDGSASNGDFFTMTANVTWTVQIDSTGQVFTFVFTGFIPGTVDATSATIPIELAGYNAAVAQAFPALENGATANLHFSVSND
jgi:hypothetical protein